MFTKMSFFQHNLCLFLALFSHLFSTLYSQDITESFKFSKEELAILNKEAICYQQRTRFGDDFVKYKEDCHTLLGENTNLCENVCF